MAQEKPILMDEETAQEFEEINKFFEQEPVVAQLIFDAVVEKIKGGN